MRASCDPFAARQPITADASTQTAMTANIAFRGEACTTRKATGTDQSSAQATVRHGTNQRGSGGTWANTAIANGVASSANSHADGIESVGCPAETEEARLRSMTKRVHAPNAATYREAILERTPRETEIGASSQGRNASAKSASTGRSSSGLRAMARCTASTTGTGSPPAVAWTLSGGNIVLPRTVVCPCIAHHTGLATGREL